MFRLTITRKTLSDGRHVYNGRIQTVETKEFLSVTSLHTTGLPDEIEFVSEKDAQQFGDSWVNLFLHRTNTPAEVKYAY